MEKDMGDYRDKVLKCPFCEGFVAEPRKIATPFGDTLDGGTCRCGAVFVFDETGRMLGEAFSDALAFAFDWDYDAAFSAEADEYEEAIIRFNARTGRYMGGQGDFRDRSSKFFFIKRAQKGYNNVKEPETEGNGGS
ncbi:MAG: hypothetical protein Kow0025_06600 [Thermodesulfovibrionales bacterium]